MSIIPPPGQQAVDLTSGKFREVWYRTFEDHLGDQNTFGFYTPEQFGAVGDGVTDDTAAVQEAVDQSIAASIAGNPKPVLLHGFYYITATINYEPTANVFADTGIIGRGKTVSGLKTDQNIPLITINLEHDIYFLTIAGFSVTGDQQSGQAGIQVEHPVGVAFLNYFSCYDMMFRNLEYGFYSPANNGFLDWGIYNNLLFYGCKYGILIRCGGTGNVYTNGNAVLSGGGTGLMFGIGGGSVVGDFIIANWQMGGGGSGIRIDGGSYGGNISVNGVQFDAGITPGFDIDNLHGCEFRNISYGGGITNIVNTGCTDTEMDSRRQYSYSLTGNTDNLSVSNDFDNFGGVLLLGSDGAYNLTGLVGGWDGREIEIINVSAFNITIKNDVTSTGENRFLIGADRVLLATGDAISLRYTRQSINRWLRRA